MNSAYFDIRWDISQNDTQFCSLLDKYFNKFVCGREVSPKGIHHYQLFTDSSGNAFANFKAKVIKQFNLKGQTKTKGVRRQYGQIKDAIKDEDNMISYCLKDGNYIYKGYLEAYILDRYANSYIKVDKLDKYEKFLKKMHEWIDRTGFSFHSRNEKLLLTSNIVTTYKEIYDSYVPKFKAQTILLDLGILSHQDYAKNLFSGYINNDNPPNDPTSVIYCEKCNQDYIHHTPTEEEINREEIRKLCIQRERDKYNKNQKILKDKFFS